MARTFYGIQLSEESAKSSYKEDCRAYMAVAPRGYAVLFPEEGNRRQLTTNRWVFGWNPTLRRWVAANARGNGRAFYTKAQLEAYAERMTTQWDWEYCPVPRDR